MLHKQNLINLSKKRVKIEKSKFKIPILIFAGLLLAFISNLTFAVPATSIFSNNIVGQWHFDEGSCSKAADSSGNNNHGTLSGPTWTDGLFGSALFFGCF